MTTYVVTPEQVAVAWVKTVPTVPADKVATTLPADSTTWGSTGFVQVSIVGGAPEPHVPLYRPIVQVDCWATNPGSAKPPWGRAGSLAQAIVWATYGHRYATPVSAGSDFQDALVLSVRPISEPRRIPDDEAGFARVQVDLELVWVTESGPVA